MKYGSIVKPMICMMTQSKCYRYTENNMLIKGVLWHSTGANNPNLKRYVQPSDDALDRDALLKKLGKNLFRNDWNHISRDAGLNAWIGKLANGEVTTVQTMPWNYKPWGCGTGKLGSCNNGWIQFEICEDNLKDKSYFEAVYKEACELTAYLCKTYGIDPKGTVSYLGVKVPTILCHQDSYRLGLGSNHSDVYHWFNKYGKSMETVRNDVAKLMDIKIQAQVEVVKISPSQSSTSTFKKGDLVAITGSTYYNGKAIPAWVKAKNWYVSSVSGDKVVIDKSQDGKNSICSPVKASGLKLVNATAKKTVDEIAKEVINGKWGNGAKRKENLIAAGYDYNAVQKRVNEMLKK